MRRMVRKILNNRFGRGSILPLLLVVLYVGTATTGASATMWLSDGYVTPESGEANSQNFSYAVVYWNTEDTPPRRIYVYINGNQNEMRKFIPGDADYTDGCVYVKDYVYFPEPSTTNTFYFYVDTATSYAQDPPGGGTYSGPIVTGKKDTITYCYDRTTTVNQSVTLEARLTDWDGNYLSGKTVKFWVGGSYVGSNSTDSGGYVYKAYTPSSAGSFTILAKFEGDSSHDNSQDSATLTVEPKSDPIPYPDSPSNGSSTTDTTPSFKFHVVNDDNDDVSATVFLDDDSDPLSGWLQNKTFPLYNSNPINYSWTPSTLTAGTTYYWAVVADDNFSEPQQSAVWSFTVTESFPTHIYVPDDYPTIQQAVDAASSDDTIIVRYGTYTESVEVDKDYLTIRSENGTESTIIQAENSTDHVFEVTANYVTISGFTIRNGDDALYLFLSTNCVIEDNKFMENFDSIYLSRSTNNIFSRNTIVGRVSEVGTAEIIIHAWDKAHYDNVLDTTNMLNGMPIYYYFNEQGKVIDGLQTSFLMLAYCSNMEIKNCNVNTGSGIRIEHSRDNNIHGNICTANYAGILCYFGSTGNNIYDNTFSSNLYGIALSSGSGSNIVHNNVIKLNKWAGISIYESDTDMIYLNDLVDNNANADSENSTNTWNTLEEMAYTYSGNTYTSYLGNYWSDYTGSDIDGNGIGDIPYSIDPDHDSYPLMKAFENYILEPTAPPDSITIQGKATLEGGSNHSGITIEVWLNGLAANTVASTTTGTDGSYQMSNVPPLSGTDWYALKAFKNNCARDFRYIYSSEATPGATINVADMLLHTQKWVSFNWVYQPDGTTNLSTGNLSSGSTVLYSTVEGPSGSSSCGFIFSSATVTDPAADVYFIDSRKYPYTFWANNGSGGVHDMGAVSLDSVTQAPDASNGVGIGEFYNNQHTDVIVGHTYCIVTKDGAHYAKIYVMGMGTGQAPTLTGTISGKVTDSFTGDPINGAPVSADGYLTTTDSPGNYSLSVPEGTYAVTASADGYGSQTKDNITVSAGETTTVDFSLEPNLLRKYAPIFYLHPDEEFCPWGIDSMLDKAELWKWLITEKQRFKESVSSADLGNSNYDDEAFYLDLKGYTPYSNVPSYETWQSYDPSGEGSGTLIYGRQYNPPDHSDKVILQYWVFYPFNDWYNDHEGDWEMVQIRYSHSIGQPDQVTTSHHHDGSVSSWSEIGKIEESHPQVFVSKGGHGNWLTSGDHPVGEINPLNDETRDNGLALYPTGLAPESIGGVASKAAYTLEELSSEPDWVDWKGRWGDVDQFWGSQGPERPGVQDKWTNPIEWGNDPSSSWYSAWVGSPVHLHVYDSQGNHVGLTGTGEVEATIPGTYFYIPSSLSENQEELVWIYTPENLQFVVEATGSGSFSFTLNMYLKEEDLLVGVAYEDVQITENTVAVLDVNPENPLFQMEIDLDGDGVIDEVKNPSYIVTDGLTMVPMTSFVIEHAKVDFKKKPDDDKVSVKGSLELNLVNGDGVDISEDVIVTVGPFSETIRMEEKGKKGDKWEYNRPKGSEGNIKKMTIDWKKRTFDIRMDKADLSSMSNPVTISIQIGDDFAEETILMEEENKWEYKAETEPVASFGIEHAKIDFKKKPDDDKVSVKGNLGDSFNNVDISEDVIVTVGPLSETIRMEEKGKKGDKWEYKRPKGGTGDIKKMTIDWNKDTFDFSIDKGDLTGVTNPVTISIQIGDDFAEETILMEEENKWEYKAESTKDSMAGKPEEDIAQVKSSLSQNYPNPFNPETTIEYSLAESCNVTLKIYNIAGQLIKTLVDEYQTAGSCSIIWHGDNDAGQEIASGVYFFQIQAGDFVSTKKMVVLK